VLVFGPTLLDLGASLGVGVAVMSAMFGARASGAAVGSIGLGYAMDRWSRHSYTILTLVLAACITCECVVTMAMVCQGWWWVWSERVMDELGLRKVLVSLQVSRTWICCECQYKSQQ